MKIVIGILGVLQVLMSFLVFAMSASAIHDILGAVAFGLGTVCVGLAIMIDRMERQLAIFERLGKPKA